MSVAGQQTGLVVTFTAINDSTYVQLDSVKIINLNKDGDTTLHWPDTTLVLIGGTVGVPENQILSNELKLFQVSPNPVKEKALITFYIPAESEVQLVITDVLGRQVIHVDRKLTAGYHKCGFTPGQEDIYLFTVYAQNQSRSAKIINANTGTAAYPSLEYLGSHNVTPNAKIGVEYRVFPFSIGDELLYICYHGDQQSGKIHKPLLSRTYVFQFATNIPCPGMETITYEGQVYNTIQVYDQCWLKENLNVGVRLDPNVYPSDNELIEKYCYDNLESNCDIYGGLYMWDEMMQYTNSEGVQGICPPGWHVPDNEDWKVLFGAVDSQYGIGDPEWEQFTCGSDVATRLKSTTGWYNNGNGTDDFGFSILPSGFYMFFPPGAYTNLYWMSEMRTSSEDEAWSAFSWDFFHSRPTTVHFADEKEFGYTVRCLKNN